MIDSRLVWRLQQFGIDTSEDRCRVSRGHLITQRSNKCGLRDRGKVCKDY